MALAQEGGPRPDPTQPGDTKVITRRSDKSAGPDLPIIEDGAPLVTGRSPRAGRRWPSRTSVRVGLAGLALAAAGGVAALRHEPSSTKEKNPTPLVVPPVDAAPPSTAVPETTPTTEAVTPYGELQKVIKRSHYRDLLPLVNESTQHVMVESEKNTIHVVNLYPGVALDSDAVTKVIGDYKKLTIPGQNAMSVKPFKDVGALPYTLKEKDEDALLVIIPNEVPLPGVARAQEPTDTFASTYDTGNMSLALVHPGASLDGFSSREEQVRVNALNELFNVTVELAPQDGVQVDKLTNASVQEVVGNSIADYAINRQSGGSASRLASKHNTQTFSFKGSKEQHTPKPHIYLPFNQAMHDSFSPAPIVKAV